MASRLKVEKETTEKYVKYINSAVNGLPQESLSNKDTESDIDANGSAKTAFRNMKTSINEYKEFVSNDASKISELAIEFEDFDQQMAKINKGK